MSIKRKKNSDGEINVSKAAGNSIEKDLAKKAVEKKKKASETTKKKVVKKVSKSSKTAKKSTTKGKKVSNGQSEKGTVGENVQNGETENMDIPVNYSKSFDDMLKELPDWFLNLFEYLDKLDGINVLATDDPENSMKRETSYSSPNELGRKLFLIFMSSPKKIWDEDKKEYKRLTQREFSDCINISQNSLSEWKGQKWFKDNHADIMKQIFRARTPDILDSLYEGATTKTNEWGKRDASAIKLWLEYIENFRPGMDVTSGGEEIKVYFGNGTVGKSPFINKNEKKGESKT